MPKVTEDKRDWIGTAYPLPGKDEQDFYKQCKKTLKKLRQLAEAYDAIYYIVGIEVCPKTNKTHFQIGLIQFKQKQTRTKLQRAMSRTYFHARDAPDPMQAINYVKPSDKKPNAIYFEVGQPDLTRILKEQITVDDYMDKLKAGEDPTQLAYKYPRMYVIYGKKIDQWIEKCMTNYKPRRTYPTVIVICGESGTGKSSSCYPFGPDQTYSWTYLINWQDDYRQQKVVLLDEFRGVGQMKIHELLKMTDAYPYSIERRNDKGGTIQFNSPYIMITCPTESPPCNWYPCHSTRNDNIQLMRRIGEVIYTDKPGWTDKVVERIKNREQQGGQEVRYNITLTS